MPAPDAPDAYIRLLVTAGQRATVRAGAAATHLKAGRLLTPPTIVMPIAPTALIRPLKGHSRRMVSAGAAGQSRLPRPQPGRALFNGTKQHRRLATR
jgi:hypothetical protein